MFTKECCLNLAHSERMEKREMTGGSTVRALRLSLSLEGQWGEGRGQTIYEQELIIVSLDCQ